MTKNRTQLLGCKDINSNAFANKRNNILKRKHRKMSAQSSFCIINGAFPIRGNKLENIELRGSSRKYEIYFHTELT
ncbi:hypothetical protein PUN28_020197 [Cardiocondyla obscurior]|uniref:Uncharacterized protein n=1 Tax=Cardiocondyla obscurior TaxID=286306 RepID=A0AAW2EB36_9HYME